MYYLMLSVLMLPLSFAQEFNTTTSVNLSIGSGNVTLQTEDNQTFIYPVNSTQFTNVNIMILRNVTGLSYSSDLLSKVSSQLDLAIATFNQKENVTSEQYYTLQQQYAICQVNQVDQSTGSMYSSEYASCKSALELANYNGFQYYTMNQNLTGQVEDIKNSNSGWNLCYLLLGLFLGWGLLGKGFWSIGAKPALKKFAQH